MFNRPNFDINSQLDNRQSAPEAAFGNQGEQDLSSVKSDGGGGPFAALSRAQPGGQPPGGGQPGGPTPALKEYSSYFRNLLRKYDVGRQFGVG